MTFRRGCVLRWNRFRVIAVVFVLVAQPGGLVAAAGAPPEPARPGASTPAPPREAVQRMTLPKGFRATLCAAEPDVVQPIAMTIDPRGRLWVVENYSYPIWLGGPRGKDRILIFEDADGDGRFERRKVFTDQGTNYTGIELGFGGVWVCATPNLLFFPDRDGDDRPDGPPVVKLDGWNIQAQHNLFNALRWGPDGWLWGCHGILATAMVGKPGTPPQGRVPMNCGVWRYHPTREVFEVVAHGTTNPWGLDFDDFGEAFITNCVIAHLFRVIPGSHFQRMYGNDFNPFLYDLMASCADHLHWAGGRWQDAREGHTEHSAFGGGHAHVGGMIYLADNWPAAYRNTIFTCNIHGHRVNNDRFERIEDGARIVARHSPDFLLSADPWFRGLELKYGPDGGVYLTDWSDTGECHEIDADNAHRENGRIFKITYGDVRPVTVDLTRQTDQELARLQLHPNEWYVRTARRLLQDRAAAGKDLADAQGVLREILATQPDAGRKLRAIWTLFVTGGLAETDRLALLEDPSPQVRAWAVRLLVDDGRPSAEAVSRLSEMAGAGDTARISRRFERSPLVRLYLGSAMQRVPVDQRWPMAEALASHGDYASDPNHALLVWYGLEPLVARDRDRAVALLGRCPSLTVCRFVARRLVAADADAGLAALLPVLQGRPESYPSFHRDVLGGILEALLGRKRAAMPPRWPTTFAWLTERDDTDVRAKAAALGLVFGDPRAEASLRAVVADRANSTDSRRFALQCLVERRADGLAPLLFTLLDDPDLRAPAIRALAASHDPATPGSVLRRYPALSSSERDDAIATLASRPAWAMALLDAVAKGTVPRRDLNTTVARQILAFRAPNLTTALERTWGTLRPTAGDKTRLIAKYKGILASAALPAPDPDRGRALFGRICAQCHRLFGQGGDIGPDLTGSDRANPDYILENVLDPNASVGRDYTVTTVATRDGRLISGILRDQTPAALVIQTPSERINVSREDVEEVKGTNLSMMPEGQLDPLS
ncbi:MAG TPA: PVC-type heme-binding CxxCH protein, partial [Isosphaeraceae bacterium]|nr:PVC-type heme-binding CxxCH protein [Isosphaeraceae bacterium]